MATQTAQFARISLALSSPTARLVLNNPPLNVIDIPMMEELAQALSGIETRSNISTIVISGAGKNFSAGVDVAAHTPDKVESMLTKFHSVIRALIAQKQSQSLRYEETAWAAARNSPWSAIWCTPPKR